MSDQLCNHTRETPLADEYPVKGIVIAVMVCAPFWAIAAFLVWKLFL